MGACCLMIVAAWVGDMVMPHTLSQAFGQQMPDGIVGGMARPGTLSMIGLMPEASYQSTHHVTDARMAWGCGSELVVFYCACSVCIKVSKASMTCVGVMLAINPPAPCKCC